MVAIPNRCKAMFHCCTEKSEGILWKKVVHMWSYVYVYDYTLIYACVCMYLYYTQYMYICISVSLLYTTHTHIHTQGHISHESRQTCIQKVAPSHGWNPVIRLDKVHLYRYGWYCYKLLVISSYIYQPSFFKALLVLTDPDCWTLLLEDPLGWRCMVALSRYAELPSPNHLRSYATHAERGNPRGLSRITPEKGTSNREIEELDMIIESQILYGDIWNFLNFSIDNYIVYFTLLCVEKCGIISGTQKIQPTKNGWWVNTFMIFFQVSQKNVGIISGTTRKIWDNMEIPSGNLLHSYWKWL